jgi:putative oxidoreductase
MRTDDLETYWAPRMLSVLRIVAGLVFWQHGVQKLLQFPVARPGPGCCR